jgi:hypothetical protein
MAQAQVQAQAQAKGTKQGWKLRPKGAKEAKE